MNSKQLVVVFAVCALVVPSMVLVLGYGQGGQVSANPDGLVIVRDKAVMREYWVQGTGDSSQMEITIQVHRDGGIASDSVSLGLWNADLSQWENERPYAWWGFDNLTYYPHAHIQNLSDGTSWRLGFQVSFYVEGVYSVTVHMRDN